MTDYELEQAAYNKGREEGILAERDRIMKIVEDELLGDFESPPWNIFIWRRIVQNVTGE